MKESKLYKVLRLPITWFVYLFLRPKFVGKENLPEDDSYILCGTHISNLDCLLIIASTKRSVHFLAKKELFQGVKKIIFNNMGLIPVDRSKKDSRPLKQAGEYLDNNSVVCIFPEGTTQKGRGLLPFKIGTVKLSYDKGVKIVPFVIKGKYKIFSRDLVIEFGKPYKVQNSNLQVENEKLRNKIKDMLKY